MNVTISFKNMEHTPAIDDKIQSKSKKLEKYFEGRVDMKWTCYVEQGKHFADINLVGPHFDFHATADSDNLYKTLDLAVDKIEKQVQKKKDKLRGGKIHHKHDASIKDGLVSEAIKGEEELQEIIENNE
jgi:putative sigma-54 modulation protein